MQIIFSRMQEFLIRVANSQTKKKKINTIYKSKQKLNTMYTLKNSKILEDLKQVERLVNSSVRRLVSLSVLSGISV